MIRKVYEVDPMVCPKCGGTMKVIAFITEYAVVDRIIDHLKIRFAAAKPPPSHVFAEVALMEAEERGERRAGNIVGCFVIRGGAGVYCLLVGAVSFFPNMHFGYVFRGI